MSCTHNSYEVSDMVAEHDAGQTFDIEFIIQNNSLILSAGNPVKSSTATVAGGTGETLN